MDTDEQEDAHEPTVQATVGIMTRFSSSLKGAVQNLDTKLL